MRDYAYGLCDFDNERAWLIDRIGFEAKWRGRKAIQHPEDARNARSARALEQLKQAVRELSPSHSLFMTMARLTAEEDAARFEKWLAEVHDHLDRYGFADEAPNPMDWLSALERATEAIVLNVPTTAVDNWGDHTVVKIRKEKQKPSQPQR